MQQIIYLKNKGVLYAFVFLCSILVSGCKTLQNTEAIDDVNVYNAAVQRQTQIKNTVTAQAETKAVLADKEDDDAADDPAIWVHPTQPEKSVIYGSNKKYGIHTYGLSGKELQFIKYAKINNVDVRQGVIMGGKTYDILAGSNRSDKSVDIFIIDDDGKIANQPDYVIDLVDMNPYGFCLYKDKNDKAYAFVNDKKGNVLQFSIDLDANKNFIAKNERQFKLHSQVEGMVADDANEILYVGEEMVGIHVFSADPKGSKRSIFMQGSTDKNPNIEFDIEGLALLPPHYLVASSQGNFTYAIFDTRTKDYIISFKVVSKTFDGIEETDGLDIYYGNLGKDYPQGIFVAQDGFNYDGEVKKTQNFKIVDLREITKFLK